MSLDAFHRAIESHLVKRFPKINVETYRPSLGLLRTPCALIEMCMGEEGKDAGDDRVPHNIHWNIHCVLGANTPNLELQVRSFAAEVFNLVRRNRWGLERNVEIPKDLNYMPGMLKSGEHGFDSFIVSWQQVIYLGQAIWSGEGIIPSEVCADEHVKP